jgi:hypothetical protein
MRGGIVGRRSRRGEGMWRGGVCRVVRCGWELETEGYRLDGR